MWKDRTKGITLLELLIMGALAFLIFLVVMKFFSAVGRGTRRSAQEISLQQTAVIVLDNLVKDLKSSTATQMVVSPEIVAIRPLDSVTPEGNQSWSDSLKVYQYSTTNMTLSLGEYALQESDLEDGGLNISAPTIAGSNIPSRTLAKGVRYFELQQSTPWKIRLILESEADSRELTIERNIYIPLKSR